MRRNKYRESFKAREHDVFKIKHSKLCGILEYEELRTRKRKQHKMFLDNIRGSSQQERIKKIKIRKKNGLEIEFGHLKHRFKKVSFMFV